MAEKDENSVDKEEDNVTAATRVAGMTDGIKEEWHCINYLMVMNRWTSWFVQGSPWTMMVAGDIVLFRSREHEDLHVEGVENRVTKACRSGGKHWREGEWKSAEARQSSRT